MKRIIILILLSFSVFLVSCEKGALSQKNISSNKSTYQKEDFDQFVFRESNIDDVNTFSSGKTHNVYSYGLGCSFPLENGGTVEIVCRYPDYYVDEIREVSPDTDWLTFSEVYSVNDLIPDGTDIDTEKSGLPAEVKSLKTRDDAFDTANVLAEELNARFSYGETTLYYVCHGRNDGAWLFYYEAKKHGGNIDYLTIYVSGNGALDLIKNL